jgi:predicted nucleic acid-binding protein
VTGETLVVDASTLVALLIDSGPDGRWAQTSLRGAALAAPAVGAFETASVLRRAEAAGRISAPSASDAHQALLGLPVEWWPYAPLAERAWELRSNVSVHDAGYVALAELTGQPLVTLDRRLSRAPGLRCEVLTP